MIDLRGPRACRYVCFPVVSPSEAQQFIDSESRETVRIVIYDALKWLYPGGRAALMRTVEEDILGGRYAPSSSESMLSLFEVHTYMTRLPSESKESDTLSLGRINEW